MQLERREVPVPAVIWPAGHSRQKKEAGAGWYLPVGQFTQISPVILLPELECLPAEQAMHSDPRAVPLWLVVWPAGHSRQDEEAGVGWYLPWGQDTQLPLAGEQSLNPVPPFEESEWKLNDAVPDE